MSNPTTTVPTPVRKDRRGGVKSVVGDFVSAERLAVATNLQWVADNCDFPKAAIGLCYAETPVTDNKEFGGLAVGDGPIFALYAGVQCYLGNDTDYEERARAQLEAGEGRGVEEVLWEYGMSSGGAAPAQTSWAAAIGQADEAADTLYVGRPIIMLSRFAAVQARAAKAIFGDEEGNLWTANGTPVLASAAASDTALIVFGWVTVYASALTSLTVPNPILNQEMALAERVYGIAVDCNFALHYAVNIAPDGGGGAVTLALTTDPAGEAPVGSVVKAQVTASGQPTDPILLYIQHNDEEPTLVGPMVFAGSNLYELDADTDGLTAGDVYGFYASHGEASAAVRSPIVTITLTDAPLIFGEAPTVDLAEPGIVKMTATVSITTLIAPEDGVELWAETKPFAPKKSADMVAVDATHFTAEHVLEGNLSTVFTARSAAQESPALTFDTEYGNLRISYAPDPVPWGEAGTVTVETNGPFPVVMEQSATGLPPNTPLVVTQVDATHWSAQTLPDEYPGDGSTNINIVVYIKNDEVAVSASESVSIAAAPLPLTADFVFTPSPVPEDQDVTVTVTFSADLTAPPTMDFSINEGASWTPVPGAITQVSASVYSTVLTADLYVAGGYLDVRVTSGSFTDSRGTTVVAPALEGWTVAELKQFAADHEPPIPIPSTATKKAEILAIIIAFLNASDEES